MNPPRPPSDPTRPTEELAGRSEPIQIQPGMMLDEFQIIRPIGKGGMGEVYQAHHQRMNRTVALKVVKGTSRVSPQARARFDREIQVLSRLNHPNVVQAHHAGEHRGLIYLVMELLEGTDLHSWVYQHGPLPVQQTLSVTLQAAEGLAFAHGQGIIHRDVKPANLFLTKTGQIRVLDFGLATLKPTTPEAAMSREGPLTAQGALMGTIDFMAPEQAMDATSADARADVYSLGCTMFFLLSGTIPFPGDTLPARLIAHRESPIPPLNQLADLDRINRLLRWMMAKKREDRPASMRDLIQTIQSWSARETTPPPSSPTTITQSVGDAPTLSIPEEETHPPRTSKPLLWLALPVVLLLGLVLIWSPWSSSERDSGSPSGPTQKAGKDSRKEPTPEPDSGDRLPEDWSSRSREQKVEWVRDELVRLNPGLPRRALVYKSKFEPTFTIGHEKLVKIDPVRHLTFLTDLILTDSDALEDITALKSLPLLEQLDLTRTAVKDVSVLAHLTQLGTLYLRDCTGVKSLEPLRNLKHLGILDCASTSVSSLDPIRGHPDLFELSIEETNVQDLAPVLSLPKLDNLECDPALLVKFREKLKMHPRSKSLKVNGKRVGR